MTAERLSRGLLIVVMACAVIEIFVKSPWLSAGTGLCLVLYLTLCWRRLGLASWVPLLLALAALAVAIMQGMPAATLLQAVDRMVFLAALLSFLGMLRSAAAIAPEVGAAGIVLTSQPPARRYLALTLGGNIFGVLVSFGGLAVLLDMAVRSIARNDPPLPPELREIKLRRMTLAVVRGFGMVSLWSPLGFGVNVLLLALPGLTYMDLGPIGLAASVVFILLGWSMDRLSAPKGPALNGTTLNGVALDGRRSPAEGWSAVLLLLSHIVLVGLAVTAVHLGLSLDFQQALLIAVPLYSLCWAAVSGLRGSGPVAAVGEVVATTARRLPFAAGEIGVFAAAGLLSVLLVELAPLEQLDALLERLALGPAQMTAVLSLGLFGLGCIGINPIITASVLGSLVSQVAIPGLSDTAIALAFMGSWACVMGFSPLMTTLAFSGALIGRSPATLGFVWNGAYCLTMLLLWTMLVAGGVWLGVI